MALFDDFRKRKDGIAALSFYLESNTPPLVAEIFHYACLVLRGSRASRKPSPMKLMHNTVIIISKPGKNHSHGALWIYLTELSSMLPQLAVGA